MDEAVLTISRPTYGRSQHPVIRCQFDPSVALREEEWCQVEACASDPHDARLHQTGFMACSVAIEVLDLPNVRAVKVIDRGLEVFPHDEFEDTSYPISTEALKNAFQRHFRGYTFYVTTTPVPGSRRDQTRRSVANR